MNNEQFQEIIKRIHEIAKNGYITNLSHARSLKDLQLITLMTFMVMDETPDPLPSSIEESKTNEIL